MKDPSGGGQVRTWPLAALLSTSLACGAGIALVPDLGQGWLCALAVVFAAGGWKARAWEQGRRGRLEADAPGNPAREERP